VLYQLPGMNAFPEIGGLENSIVASDIKRVSLMIECFCSTLPIRKRR